MLDRLRGRCCGAHLRAEFRLFRRGRARSQRRREVKKRAAPIARPAARHSLSYTLRFSGRPVAGPAPVRARGGGGSPRGRPRAAPRDARPAAPRSALGSVGLTCGRDRHSKVALLSSHNTASGSCKEITIHASDRLTHISVRIQYYERGPNSTSDLGGVRCVVPLAKAKQEHATRAHIRKQSH